MNGSTQAPTGAGGEHPQQQGQAPSFNDLRGKPVEKLPPPINSDRMREHLQKVGYPSQPQLKNEWIADGIFLKGIDPKAPQLPQILGKIVNAINTVKDEHMPAVSVVQFKFVRGIGIELAKDGLHVKVFMRFTVDDCPAGQRMTAKVKSSIEGSLSNTKAEVIHGGSKWDIKGCPEPIQKVWEKVMRQVSDNLTQITVSR